MITTGSRKQAMWLKISGGLSPCGYGTGAMKPMRGQSRGLRAMEAHVFLGSLNLVKT